MKPIPKRVCTAADLAVLLLLAAVTVFLFLRPLLFPADAGGFFTVTTPGGALSYSLSEDRVIPLESNGIHLTVTVKGGAVAVTESDCPDGVCRQTGAIGKTGEAIVCAPGRIVIEVTGGGGADEDFIVG